MKTHIDCIPCFVEHGVHTAKMASSDPAQVDAMVTEILQELLKHSHSLPPPLMARRINDVVRRQAKLNDLYVEVKDSSTKFAKEILVSIMPELEAQPDRFNAIVRLAIAGNIIDFGVDKAFKLETAKEKIIDAFGVNIDHDAILRLHAAMESAKDILYITDNCGEAVFDKLLIEPFHKKTTLAVRGMPILNDLTRREIASSGLEGLPAKIIDTGDFTPGISLEHSSKEFLEAFKKAGLIVAKGQGNYETLSGSDRPIFFLFRAKCKVVTEALGGVPLGSYQVVGINIPPQGGK